MISPCLLRVPVFIAPARTTQPVKPVFPTKATAAYALLDSRVRTVKMVRRTGGLVKTESLHDKHATETRTITNKKCLTTRALAMHVHSNSLCITIQA